VTRSTGLVIGTSLALSLPYTILVAVRPMPPHNDIPGLHLAFYILFIFASVVNQVIYVFSNKFYKKAFYHSFGIQTSPDTSVASTVETQKLNLVPVVAAARFKIRAKKFSIVQNS
jgi:hypothetical protein